MFPRFGHRALIILHSGTDADPGEKHSCRQPKKTGCRRSFGSKHRNPVHFLAWRPGLAEFSLTAYTPVPGASG